MPKTRSFLSSPPLPPSLPPLPLSPTSSMTFRPGSKAVTAGVLKRGDTEHKVKVSPEPLSEIDRVGQPGSNSTNPCDSGPLVGLFIISRQHTRAWNIGLLRHWVLAAGGRNRERGDTGGMPMSVPSPPGDFIRCSGTTLPCKASLSRPRV